MPIGISKEDLPDFLTCLKEIYFNSNEYMREYDIANLVTEYCKELDPWLPIDENTPKDRDLLITDKTRRKCIGRRFSSGIWCIQGKLDSTPTHWKELPGDPL